MKTTRWTRPRLGFAFAILAVVAAGAAAAATGQAYFTPDPLKHDRMDTIRCRDYTCRARCGDTQYTIGVCVDGGNRSPITIECCCCNGGKGKNAYFVGG